MPLYTDASRVRVDSKRERKKREWKRGSVMYTMLYVPHFFDEYCCSKTDGRIENHTPASDCIDRLVGRGHKNGYGTFADIRSSSKSLVLSQRPKTTRHMCCLSQRMCVRRYTRRFGRQGLVDSGPPYIPKATGLVSSVC